MAVLTSSSVAIWLKPFWCLLTWGCWLGGGPLYPFGPCLADAYSGVAVSLRCGWLWSCSSALASARSLSCLRSGGARVLCGGKYGGGIASLDPLVQTVLVLAALCVALDLLLYVLVMATLSTLLFGSFGAEGSVAVCSSPLILWS